MVCIYHKNQPNVVYTIRILWVISGFGVRFLRSCRNLNRLAPFLRSSKQHPLCKKNRFTITPPGKTKSWFTWKSPVFEKENHLNQTFIFGFEILIFRGAIKIRGFRSLKMLWERAVLMLDGCQRLRPKILGLKSTLRIIGPSNGRVWTCISGVRVLKTATSQGSGFLGQF